MKKCMCVAQEKGCAVCIEIMKFPRSNFPTQSQINTENKLIYDNTHEYLELKVQTETD